jgi:hypothetical protein
MVIHIPGERRRTFALASALTLIIYLIDYAVAHIKQGSDVGRFANDFLILPFPFQVGTLFFIWCGAWFLAYAQHEMISHNEGAYGIFHALFHTRGMRLIGLSSTIIVIALLVGTLVFNTLSTSVGIIGILVVFVLFSLGLPDSPSRRYHVGGYERDGYTPATPLETSHQIVDAE